MQSSKKEAEDQTNSGAADQTDQTVFPWKATKNLLNNIQKGTKIHHSPDEINTQFCRVFQADSHPCEIQKAPCCDLEELKVTEFEVADQMKKLKNTAVGIDQLPAWIFREFADIFAEVIAEIFNTSLSSCIFPDILKFALVTPIPKVKNPGLTDYGPISVLPILSKVFEKLVLKKWVFPVVINKMDKYQFAFTPGLGKGCTNALTLLQH